MPRFDEIDPFTATHFGEVALINRLLAKPSDPDGGGAFEILSFELAQSYSFDDDVPCTDPPFTGAPVGCPEANITADTTGTMLVLVATFGGDDCPNNGPYSLDIAVNGTDIDLSGGPAIDDRVDVCL